MHESLLTAPTPEHTLVKTWQQLKLAKPSDNLTKHLLFTARLQAIAEIGPFGWGSVTLAVATGMPRPRPNAERNFLQKGAIQSA